ncbi:WD40 repeat domain-containing protein [Allocoleopsis franciscana]|uniref:WD40 repeat-containing protein n=1 Tax=Allocoleopsis franciscana PCC 7113 TaxID=1173027 RepID=K9WFF2_9CYAN|nr:WD40 repeat-containing protein [Allocoleopsis franciscana]AFZ18948.1 WD40 repeat-containing protein [Allocoleopsis franciscana PCC 7113]
MQLLPYDTFTIHTRKPLEDVIEQLDAQIEAPKPIRWSFSRNHALYEGTINSSGFKINRIIHYRNSFIPNIQGRFEPSSDGTLIRVTLKLHPFVTAFLVFWYLVWYSATIPLFLFGALSGDVDVITALQFVGMPIVLLFVFWCTFWYEANRSRRELAQIILEEPLGQTISSNLKRRALWILAITAIILWNGVFLYFLPSVQRRLPSVTSKYCSQNLIQSPYCNFSVIHSLDGHPTASAIAISADGKTLVSGGQDKAIKIWDLSTGELKKTLQSDSGEIEALAIAPDGKTVVSGSGDLMVRIWDITSNQRPRMLKGHSYRVNQIEIASDGKTIISRTYNEIKVWDLVTGHLKATLPKLSATDQEIGSLVIKNNSPYFRPLTISPDGKRALVELGNKLIMWDLATNEQKILQKKAAFESIGSARISIDGQTVVTTSSSSKPVVLKVRDLKTGTVKAHRRVISSPSQSSLNIVLSRTQATGTAEVEDIISSTKEGLTVWNLQTAELEAILETQQMSHLVVSPDGKLLAGITGDADNRNTQIKVLRRP